MSWCASNPKFTLLAPRIWVGLNTRREVTTNVHREHRRGEENKEEGKKKKRHLISISGLCLGQGLWSTDGSVSLPMLYLRVPVI